MTERLLRGAFHATSAPLAVVDAEGVIAEVNEAVLAISGFERDALVGRPFWAFISPRDESLSEWPRLVAGDLGSYTTERRFIDRSGQELALGLTVMPINGDRGPEGFVVHVDDRTGRRRAEDQTWAAEDRFSSAFEFAPIGMALVGLDGTWLRVNQALCRLVGQSEDRLLRLRFQDITHPDDVESDLAQVRRLLDGEIASYELEKRYVRPSGESVYVQLNVSLARDAAGASRYFIAQIQDVSDRKRAERELELRSHRDVLTGLANRRALIDRLDELADQRDGQGRIAVLFADVDAFKQVNDRYGHQAGDEMLIEVGARLEAAVRHGDLVARFGGDEFVVLARLDDGDVDRLRRRVSALVNRPVELSDGSVVDVHVSVGGALVAPGRTATELLAVADASMYAAKRSRRLLV